MDLAFLNEHIVIVIVGICGCVGYVLKQLDFIPNKFIPLILTSLGTLINILMNLPNISAAIILSGMASGLASTGTYEAIRHLTKSDKKTTDENNNDKKE